MKILWFDVETTGLNPDKHDIITLSLMIEVDGQIVESANFKMQPFDWEAISDDALKINGITREELKTFPKPQEVKQEIQAIFNKYINKFKKNETINDKFVPAGYNVLFDVRFLASFWEKCGDNYFGSYIDYHKLDVASIVLFLKMNGLIEVEGFKLVNVANALDIPIQAHDAQSDIVATRNIAYNLIDKMKEFK